MNAIDQYLEHLDNTHDLSFLPPNYNEILEKDMLSYIDKIKICNDPESADSFFDALGVFQEKLARLHFYHKVKISEKLRFLVSNFDRPDDIDARKYFFAIAKKI